MAESMEVSRYIETIVACGIERQICRSGVSIAAPLAEFSRLKCMETGNIAWFQSFTRNNSIHQGCKEHLL